MPLVEMLTGEAPGAIHWLEELGVEFTRENGGYRLARCGGAIAKAAPPGRRPHRARDHTALREAFEALGRHSAPATSRWSSSSRARTAGARAAATHEVDAATVILAAGGRCYREAEERGELSTNHPGATGEVTQIVLSLGAEARDLDALQYHPNGGAWPQNMQGYSIPETTRAYGAVLLNADREEFTDSLGPRDAVSQAIFDEVERGAASRRGRPARRLPRHDSNRARGRRDLPAVHAPPVPCSRHRPPAAADLTYPVLHYQNGGLVIDEHGETTLEGLYACGEIAGGTHGRNRMMGNSLLECCVFGRRAGRAAAERARA